MPTEPWVAIGVPIDSVGRAGGTELAPAAVRERDLAERLGARDAGDLVPRIRGDKRDAETGVVGIDGVLAVTEAVRAAVGDAVAVGARPLLIGGCCTLVPGALAGLRDAGAAAAIANVDGHVDVYDGVSSPTGEAADMPVGVALGREPARWVAAAGGPSVRPGQVVALGARDPRRPRTSPPCWPAIWRRSRCSGPRRCARRGSRPPVSARPRGSGASGSTSTSTSSTRRRCRPPTT